MRAGSGTRGKTSTLMSADCEVLAKRQNERNEAIRGAEFFSILYHALSVGQFAYHTQTPGRGTAAAVECHRRRDGASRDRVRLMRRVADVPKLRALYACALSRAAD